MLGIVLMLASVGATAEAGAPDDGIDRNRTIDSEATVTAPEPGRPPAPPCVWRSKSATQADFSAEKAFWGRIDGGAHYDEVLVFFEAGSLRRTWVTSQITYVLQVRVCGDRDDPDHGRTRWSVVGPPNPTLLWDELTERVTRRVPDPDPNLGFAVGDDGRARIVVNLGLWIAVDNPDDIVARAEPAPGVWAEARATLDHIEFESGTGGGSGSCPGAGTPLPADHDTLVDQGGCGYTYTRPDELGDHTATLRAVWRVTNTSSNTTGATQRPDIVVETLVPITVVEIQTVGTG